MKITVIGGSSFIGYGFVKLLSKKKYEVKYSYFENIPQLENGYFLDITNKEKTKEFFRNDESDAIIVSSALTNVDLCEKEPTIANKINVKGIQNIIEGINNPDAKIIYLSTSAVFDGIKSEYHEQDETNPTSQYGITKLAGEKIVMDSKNPFLVLRTDQPYGWKEKWQHTNSVLRVIENLKINESFNEIENWFNSPTYVPDFVKITEMLMENESEGIFHLVGSDFVSRYDWALEVAKIFNLKINLINKINSDELNLPVKRANVHLSNQKVEQETGYKMIGIKKGLEKMKDKLCQK